MRFRTILLSLSLTIASFTAFAGAEFTNMMVAQASAGGPILLDPKGSTKVGEKGLTIRTDRATVNRYTFINDTDTRCVVNVKTDGTFSIGCGGLGGSKTEKPKSSGAVVVTIEKRKDKWGKADEVTLRIADRK